MRMSVVEEVGLALQWSAASMGAGVVGVGRSRSTGPTGRVALSVSSRWRASATRARNVAVWSKSDAKSMTSVATMVVQAAVGVVLELVPISWAAVFGRVPSLVTLSG
jgi:hypothetical protein